MNDCQQIQQSLEIFALDENDCVDANFVRDHLKHCEACRLALRELRDAWAMLPATLDPIKPSKSMEDDLMARLHTQKSPLLVPKSLLNTAEEEHPLVRHHWLKYPMAASILIGIVSLFYFQSPVDQNQNELAKVDQELEEIAKALKKIDLIKRDFGAPELQYVTLDPVQPLARVSAYLVYDFVAKEAHLLARGLQPHTENSVYKIWLIDKDNEVLTSSTLLPDENQFGSAVITLPQSISSISEIILSLESSGDATKPSGKVELRTRFISK